MTDSTPAPAPSPASPSEGAPEGAPASTPAETAAAGLETLAADKAWQADFNGDNGRPAQHAAVKLKFDVTRAAYSPEAATAPALSENIESGLHAPDSVTKAAAEAMTPATSADDFTFKWENAASMEIEELQSMDKLAKETAFAVKAPPRRLRGPRLKQWTNSYPNLKAVTHRRQPMLWTATCKPNWATRPTLPLPPRLPPLS